MDAVSLIRLALEVISDRLMTILGLGLCFGLSCWAMYFPTYERIGILAIFSIYSYILIKVMENRNGGQKTVREKE